MTEVWKDILGYEGKYQVSNLGNIRSLRYNGGNAIKVLTPNNNGHGYMSIALCDGSGNRKVFYIHRLVAQAFLNNTDNLPHVNHLDHNRENNCISNLEWSSIKDNLMYGTTHARAIATLRNTHPSRKPVIQFDASGNIVGEFCSTHEAERETGVNSSCISLCCRGKIKTSGGYKWKYL